MKIKYSNFHGDYVVNETCECGHLKSEHGSLIEKIDGLMYREFNAGSCCQGKCKCKKFLYTRSITVDEAANIAIVSRNLSEGVIVANAQGEFLYWNDRALDLIGLGARNSSSPKNWSEDYGVYKDETCEEEWPVDELPLAQAIKGRYVDVHLFIKNKNNKGCWLQVSGEPLRNDEQNQGGFITLKPSAGPVALI